MIAQIGQWFINGVEIGVTAFGALFGFGALFVAIWALASIVGGIIEAVGGGE